MDHILYYAARLGAFDLYQVVTEESLEEYALDSVEAAYEYPGQQAPMGFMASGGEFHEAGNDSHWLYQK